jgi:hypothetical protein
MAINVLPLTLPVTALTREILDLAGFAVKSAPPPPQKKTKTVPTT